MSPRPKELETSATPLTTYSLSLLNYILPYRDSYKPEGRGFDSRWGRCNGSLK